MPAAVPYIAVAAAIAGTAVSTYSAVRAGQEQQSAREREAEQMRRSAEQSRLAAAQKAADYKKASERVMATQRARYAAAGLEEEGSPLLVQLESLKESQDEISRIIAAGELGYGTSVFAAQTTEAKGQAAVTSGYVTAAGEAVRGVGSAGQAYYGRNWWDRP